MAQNMDEEAKKAVEDRAAKVKELISTLSMSAAQAIFKFVKENSIMDEEELLNNIASRIEGTCMMSTMIMATF